MRRPVVLRWDLDKTYLVSDFDSLRALARVPFERGRDKTAVPGVVSLMRGLRRTAERRRRSLAVYFLSASPRQLSRSIRDKLAIDEVVYDGITFKNQVQHLVRGHLGALREQVGYKLSELLSAARSTPAGSVELLFGDDYESDPFVYSLYADIVGGRVDRGRALAIVDRIGIEPVYREAVCESLATPLPAFTVGGVFVLRQRPRAAVDLEAFGARLRWFDDYFECALILEAVGLVDERTVVDVAAEIGSDAARLAESLEAVSVRRGGPSRAALEAARRALDAALLLEGPRRAALLPWVAVSLRRAVGLPAASLPQATTLPAYEELVAGWARVRAASKEETDG